MGLPKASAVERRAGHVAASKAVLDPQGRWSEIAEKPDYAGLLTFAGVPYSEDPLAPRGAEVAIIGTAMWR